jgi:hypothetical protein
MMAFKSSLVISDMVEVTGFPFLATRYDVMGALLTNIIDTL